MGDVCYVSSCVEPRKLLPNLLLVALLLLSLFLLGMNLMGTLSQEKKVSNRWSKEKDVNQYIPSDKERGVEKELVLLANLKEHIASEDFSIVEINYVEPANGFEKVSVDILGYTPEVPVRFPDR